MCFNAPKWLNENFMVSCLQEGKDNEEITIKLFSTSTVVPPGYSFSSLLFRVNVVYQKRNTKDVQNTTVIVKGTIENASEDFIKTEPMFYNKYLPAALKISQNFTVVPKTYYSPISDVVVMEDLSEEGYLLADKRALLDIDHCILYAKASATFHAISVSVHSKCPTLVESLGSEKFFSDDFKSPVGMKKLCIGGLLYMAEQMVTFDEYKNYADIIRSSATRIWDMMVESLKPNGTFNALSQGDPWTTNMMFKYDQSGKVIDIKLLDFQGLRYSSPVCDLIFFIWSSSKYDVRENKLEDIYRTYCDTLNDKLKEFNSSECLHFEQFLEHVRRLSFKVLIVVSVTFPLIFCPTYVDATSLMFGNCDESLIKKAFDQCYDDDYCKFHLPRILKQLADSGTFEYIENKLRI